MWIVYSLPFHMLELRHPFPDIFPVSIELLALQYGIEDPEVRLGVNALFQISMSAMPCSEGESALGSKSRAMLPAT